MDFADLGAHCAYPLCQQQDYLPFLCDSCGHRYCLNHRTESSHQCSHSIKQEEKKN